MSIIPEVMIRSIVSFFTLLLLVRLMGKQQMAELNFFDYVVGITIGSIAAALSSTTGETMIAHLTAMAIWTIFPILLAYASIHNVWIRKIVEGEGTIVIENGAIIEKNLSKIRITIDDLISQLRTKDVFDIADVEFAMFESNGILSVQKKSQKRFLTPADMQIATRYEGLPTNLVEDGVILSDALKSLKLSKAWLKSQFMKVNIQETEQVSLAQLDTQGNLYVDLKGVNSYYVISTTEINK